MEESEELGNMNCGSAIFSFNKGKKTLLNFNTVCGIDI